MPPPVYSVPGRKKEKKFKDYLRNNRTFEKEKRLYLSWPMNFYRKKSLTRETVCLAQYMSVSKYSDCKLGPEQSDASFTAIYWNKGKKVELA